jgi:hypothetical protein
MAEEKIFSAGVYHKSCSVDWILLIRGFGGSARTWKKQIDFFSDHYNLLVLEMHKGKVNEGLDLDQICELIKNTCWLDDLNDDIKILYVSGNEDYLFLKDTVKYSKKMSNSRVEIIIIAGMYATSSSMIDSIMLFLNIWINVREQIVVRVSRKAGGRARSDPGRMRA